MATLGIFADQIIEELGYTTQDKGLDRRNIIVRADAIRSEMISNLVTGATLVTNTSRVGIVAQRELNDALYISRIANITFDLVRQRFYADMPTEYINFNSYSGIRKVAGAQDNSGTIGVPTMFFNQKVGAGSAYNELESARLMGGVGYEAEGQRLYFNNMPAGSYTKVLITYIPSLIGLSEDDVLPCSAEFAKQLMDATKEAFGFKRGIPENQSANAITE